MNKCNVVYTYNGMLLSHKKEWNSDICYNMAQKDKYMIPLIWGIWKRQIHKDRKWSRGCQGQEERENGKLLLNGHRVSVWHDEKVLEIEIMSIVLSGTELIHFKMINVLACIFYHN